MTTLPHKESSGWTKPAPPPYLTALCTKCLTTALERCRYDTSFCTTFLLPSKSSKKITNLLSWPKKLDFRTPPGFDRTRNAEIGNKDIKLKHLEEAFTSEHWLVRIYKVNKLENRHRVEHKLRSTNTNKQKYTSKKVSWYSCLSWSQPNEFVFSSICGASSGLLKW